MIDEDITLANRAQLFGRGWTRSLIEKYLKEPDEWGTVDHWQNYKGKALYSLERVMQAESNINFAATYTRSVSRRNLSSETVAQIAEKRKNGNDAYRKWLKGIKPEQVRDMILVAEVAAIFNEAIARGYRTPHK